jgi:hypothetical protein
MKIITKKKAVIYIGVILLILAYFSPQIYQYYWVKKELNAVASFPTQLGLNNVMLTQCTISCNGGCCTGGALCSTLDSGRCTSYQEVKGSPAGGTGNMTLLSMMQISGAGVAMGNPMIAGCMTPNMCDSGVVAGLGGCIGAGCGGL